MKFQILQALFCGAIIMLIMFVTAVAVNHCEARRYAMREAE